MVEEQKKVKLKLILFEKEKFKASFGRTDWENFKEHFDTKWDEIIEQEKNVKNSKEEFISEKDLNHYKCDIKYKQSEKDVTINSSLVAVILATVAFGLSVFKIGSFSGDFSLSAESIWDIILSVLTILVTGLTIVFFVLVVTFLISLLRLALKGNIEKYEMKLLDYQLDIVEEELKRRNNQRNHVADEKKMLGDLERSINQLQLKIEDVEVLVRHLDTNKQLSEPQKHTSSKNDESILSLEKTVNDLNNGAKELRISLEAKLSSIQGLLENATIESKNNKTDETIQKMEKMLSELNSIDNIAQELRMISLNASIESAKSQSSGFMLISTQIKQLTDNLIDIVNRIKNNKK
ncbi:hypothetical protein R9X47_25700 [Wukongibacter baidiensis]|uniref:hypothetical protein n=1 Tax=Wukongibacter baidiensis TaxID=1723361 RepID=UPI003D7F4B10